MDELSENCWKEIWDMKGDSTMQKEIDDSIRINVTILRADGISARIDWINEKSRPYNLVRCPPPLGGGYPINSRNIS